MTAIGFALFVFGILLMKLSGDASMFTNPFRIKSLGEDLGNWSALIGLILMALGIIKFLWRVMP